MLVFCSARRAFATELGGVYVCVCVKTHPAYMYICIYAFTYVHRIAYNSRCIRLQSSVSSPDFAACKNSVVVAVSTWTSLSPSPFLVLLRRRRNRRPRRRSSSTDWNKNSWFIAGYPVWRSIKFQKLLAPSTLLKATRRLLVNSTSICDMVFRQFYRLERSRATRNNIMPWKVTYFGHFLNFIPRYFIIWWEMSPSLSRQNSAFIHTWEKK